MQTMRETWTDERLDDLSKRVYRGFDRVDQDLRGVRTEIESLRRLLVQAILGISAAMLTGFAALATLIVTTSG